MILFIGILLFTLAYFTVGARVSRHFYAVAKAEQDAIPEAERAAVLLSKMEHGYICYQNPDSSWYQSGRDCDCDQNQEWKKLKRGKAEQDLPNPYRLMVVWPGVFLHRYLTTGELKGYNPALIRQLERMCEIPELEKPR